MPEPTSDIRIIALLADMQEHSGDFAVLAALSGELSDYLAGLLAPPNPYADKALRPGLNAMSHIHATVNVAGPPPTKSSGDPTFDPTLPKDTA